MRLYNVLTHAIEPFSAADPVRVYVCGITPYDTTHLGHAFTYTVFDVLIRYLEHRGHSVRYVQNVTDIDDDILRKAGEMGEDWIALGNRWTARFITDLQQLNLRPPDVYPRATEVIAQIVAGVTRLLQAGVAYENGGNVYFHIDAWPLFGRLSRLPRDQMLAIANQRGNVANDPHKRDPLDFVLWQAMKPGEPYWPSPWGPGRPGWHIECSTLAGHYLGETIDIHGGGGDLIFPHHECEIAQVEPVSGRPFVRFWMHAAMVYHQGEKMSKSLGNLIMARDLLRDYTADALRLYLASHHYRTSWCFDEALLQAARARAFAFDRALAVRSGTQPAPPELLDSIAHAENRFHAAMEEDLDTPAALAALDDLVGAVQAGGSDG
ncbi:MAG: cysteine--tRNA ligase, partial [Caldilineales bacterium]|nr:cysteine--tRNA ligase [Caldilineales bacterium]